MTLRELLKKTDFEILNESDFDIQLTKPFTCDLLSVCMSKASAGCLWVTVMGNTNAVAVASLTDTACIILAEDAKLDEIALLNAKTKGVNILKSRLPIFETALKIYQSL